eukprot:21619_1
MGSLEVYKTDRCDAYGSSYLVKNCSIDLSGVVFPFECIGGTSSWYPTSNCDGKYIQKNVNHYYIWDTTAPCGVGNVTEECDNGVPIVQQYTNNKCKGPPPPVIITNGSCHYDSTQKEFRMDIIIDNPCV